MLFKNRLFWTGETKADEDDDQDQEQNWDGPLVSEVSINRQYICLHVLILCQCYAVTKIAFGVFGVFGSSDLKGSTPPFIFYW